MTNTPHDALVRFVFATPEHAAALFRVYLPADVVARTDWSRLRLVTSSNVDEELQQYHSDLLFTAPVGGAESFFYILFEHQSQPDPLLAFRVLRYEVRIWERWLREHPTAQSLPAILPVVLYNGEAAWNKPLEFAELIALEPELLRPLLGSVPRLRLLLDDLSRADDAQLLERSMTALVQLSLLLLKHSRREDLPKRLFSYARLVRDVFQAPNGREALNAVVSYISFTNEAVRSETINEVLTQAFGESQGSTAMTTLGEQLLEKGRLQGIEEGLEKGREEGREAGVLVGKREALLATLRIRWGGVPASIEQRILHSPRPSIDAWFVQALRAATLEEVFKEGGPGPQPM